MPMLALPAVTSSTKTAELPPAPVFVPLPVPTTEPLLMPTAVPFPAPTAVPVPALTVVPLLLPTAVPFPAHTGCRTTSIASAPCTQKSRGTSKHTKARAFGAVRARLFVFFATRPEHDHSYLLKCESMMTMMVR